MSEVKRMGFGGAVNKVDDNDQSLKGKASGVFGLNSSVHFVKLAYNPNGGADGAAADCVDINVKINDRDYNRRVYNITGDLYDSKNNKIEMADTDEYNALYNAEMKQRQAVILHAVKSTGVTQEQIDTALATEVESFAKWAEIVTSLVPSDYTSKPIDCFLQYQWDISNGQERTFLELAKNMKGGRFLSPHVAPEGGEWKATNTSKGFRYIDGKGNEHPFVKSVNFMESPKGYEQKEGEDCGPLPLDGQEASGRESFSKPATTAKKSTW